MKRLLCVILCISFFTQACTPFTITRPFKVIDKSQGPQQEQYWVVLTEAQINPDTKNGKSLFKDYVSQIAKTLPDQPGLYGFSLRQELFGKKAWTLTVWSNKEAIKKFRNSDPHLSAIARVPDMLSAGKFLTFQISSSDLPIKWSSVLAKLETEGRSYTY